MRKHGKLLCAVLVFALLCSSLAFVVGAAEDATFTKSFEVTKFPGNKISDGSSLASANMEGNRVTVIETMNPDHSPFISMGKVDGKNPYVVAYANQSYSGKPSASNNISVSVSTDKSAPITVKGAGVKGYYVLDFDVATHGNVIPDVTVSMVMRRESDGSGFPFSDDLAISKYIESRDSWSHLTVVGDLVNNVAKIYIDGQYVGDGGLAVRTNNDANILSGDTRVTAQGARVQITRNNVQTNVTDGDNIALDNFAHRLFIEDGDALTTAIADGDITDWEGYNAGRSGEKLAVLATVDGVEYRNANKLQSALNTNDSVSVEFKAQPIGPVKVTANATINTNGMDKDDLITLGASCVIKTERGNVIVTSAPFVSNISVRKIQGNVFSIVRASNPDNQLGASDGSSGIQYVGYYSANMRGTELVTDTYTGSQYIRDGVYSGTVASTANTYIDWHTSNDRSLCAYKLGVDQHIIFDLDFAFEQRGRKVNLNPITRNSSNGGVWGNSCAYIDDVYTAAGIPDGQFAHITAVLSIDTRELTVFVNGEHVSTISNAISGIESGYYLSGFRMFSNGDATAYYNNVSLRSVESAEVTAALAEKDITLWSGNLYDSDYKMVEPAAIATVDGVAYNDEAEIEAALYGNKAKPAVVKILNVFDNTITVNCDAVIYTYGQDVKFVDINGEPLVPENGVINLDLPYMQNREEDRINVAGTGLVDMPGVYAAVKANVNNNLFSKFTMHTDGEDFWSNIGYRNASLITNVDTGNVFYRESANFNTDGSMNSDANQYVNMQFDKVELTYEAGKNEYIVVDFDFGTDDVINDDIALQLIPRDTTETLAGAWSNELILRDLPIASGKMAHVTVVYDFTNNYAHVFVDGVFIYSVEDGAMDDELGGASANRWTEEYLAGNAFTVSELKLCSSGKTSTVCLDNVAFRAFEYAAEADGLADAVNTMDITDWSESVYGADYNTAKLPAVATVDGEDYGSVGALNEALATESVYSKNVVIKHTPKGAIVICNDAVVETNALDVVLDWNTGAYEFDPGIDRYRSTSTGLAYASTRLLRSVVGTVYSFRTINAENCMNNATAVIWAYDNDFTKYDVVFYSYGDTIAPLDGGEYIKGDKFYSEQWTEMLMGDDGFVLGDVVTEFPAANSATATNFYLFTPETEEVGFAATDILYGAKIDANIEFTLYVNADQTVTETGSTVTIGENEYVAITYRLAPHEIDKVITVKFDVVDSEGNVYVQKQDICFLEYAKALLSEFGSDDDKALMVAFLAYANEAYALFNEGEDIEAVSDLLEAYASLLPENELTQKLDTSALASVIRSAAMKLNSAPEFVFKVARGFVGTIEFRLGTEVILSKAVDATDAETLVVLDGLSVYDLCSYITIVVTEEGAQVPIVGAYDLASYAQGLSDNAFAVALYNYAKASLAYQASSSEFATPEI